MTIDYSIQDLEIGKNFAVSFYFQWIFAKHVFDNVLIQQMITTEYRILFLKKNVNGFMMCIKRFSLLWSETMHTKSKVFVVRFHGVLVNVISQNVFALILKRDEKKNKERKHAVAYSMTFQFCCEYLEMVH